MDLRGNKDFLAGLVFLAFGVAAMRIADNDYPMGTAMRMGPGNFPLWLGWILAGFGVYLAARGVWQMVRRTPGRKAQALDFVAGGDPARTPAAWNWRDAAWSGRAVACIVASMLVFGFLMPRLGLVPALVAMLFIAAFGGREFRWREASGCNSSANSLAHTRSDRSLRRVRR